MKTFAFYHEVAKKELKGNFWPYAKVTFLYLGITIILPTILSPLSIFLISDVYSLCIAFPLGYAYTNTYLDHLRQAKESPTKRMLSIFRKEWKRAICSQLLISVLGIAILIPFILADILLIYIGVGGDASASMQEIRTKLMSLGMLTILGAFLPITIFAIAVSQTSFLVHDNPEKRIRDCVAESFRLMNGHKVDLVILYLTFLGWFFMLFLLFCCEIICIYNELYLVSGICFLFLLICLTRFIPRLNFTLAAFYRDLISEQPEASEGNTEIEENTL